MESEKKSNKRTGIAVGAAVVVIIALVALFSGGNSPAATEPVSPAPVPAATTPVPPADISKQTSYLYKDGTYSATGSYMSPGGADQIAVTLTLANDIVTDVSVTPMPGDNTSARYQNMFAAGYKQLVVGQDISTLSLSKVSGSSLTPKGFDDALTQIKAQAQA